MWRPLGVKSHWENKKQKNKMWRPMGIKKPLGNQKKQKTKCGDQWG